MNELGKSSITLRFVYDEFEESYDPTKADFYRRRLKDFKGNNFEIDILDTAGQEEYAAVCSTFLSSYELVCIFNFYFIVLLYYFIQIRIWSGFIKCLLVD